MRVARWSAGGRLSLEGLLQMVLDALEAAGIPSMLTGSVAAAYRGSSRSTIDVDFVIDPTGTALDDFVRRIDARGLCVSREEATEALAIRRMFKVVDSETGWKADLIVRKERAYSRTEFARREATDFFGIALNVASIEDVILSKLEWSRLGGSARQLEDVRALLRVSAGTLDQGYLNKWIDVLDVRKQWESVR